MENTNYYCRYHYSTYLLAVFFVLLPFEYPLAQNGVGSVLKYVGILVMLIALFDVASGQIYRIKIDYRIIIIGVWILLVLFSSVWAYDQSRYAYFSSMYINNALMFFIVSMVKYDQEEAALLKKAYVLGVTILLLYMTFVPGAVTYSEWQHRLTLASADGTAIMDQNYLASIMLMPYAIVLNTFLENSKAKIMQKIYYLIFCFGVIYYVFSTGSRSGLIALCLMSGLILKKNARKHALIIVLVVLLLILIIPYMVRLMPSDMLDRFTIDALTGKTIESDDRLQLWRIAIDSLGNGLRFITGYGSGSSIKVVGQSYVSDTAIHNFYLAHLVEFGIIGFILFITLIIRLIKDSYRQSNHESIYGFIGILFMGVFLDLLTTKFFWTSMLHMTVLTSASKKSVTRM